MQTTRPSLVQYSAAGDKLERLRAEIENLTASLAAGVDPLTIRQAINERAKHVEKLESLGNVELPTKLSIRDLDRQAVEVRKIAESRDTDRKRAILRDYIAAMTAYPEKRTVKVTVRPLSTICGHSLVAPKGFEPSISWLRTMHPGPLDDGATYII